MPNGSFSALLDALGGPHPHQNPSAGQRIHSAPPIPKQGPRPKTLQLQQGRAIGRGSARGSGRNCPPALEDREGQGTPATDGQGARLARPRAVTSPQAPCCLGRGRESPAWPHAERAGRRGHTFEERGAAGQHDVGEECPPQVQVGFLDGKGQDLMDPFTLVPHQVWLEEQLRGSEAGRAHLPENNVSPAPQGNGAPLSGAATLGSHRLLHLCLGCPRIHGASPQGEALLPETRSTACPGHHTA